MVEDRLKTATASSIRLVIVFVSIVSSFQIVQCGPSAQQEHELLLLDALSRKQISTSLNAISTNNYESNAIMDMLGRSMLSENQNCFHFRFHLITVAAIFMRSFIFVSVVCSNGHLIGAHHRGKSTMWTRFERSASKFKQSLCFWERKKTQKHFNFYCTHPPMKRRFRKTSSSSSSQTSERISLSR